MTTTSDEQQWLFLALKTAIPRSYHGSWSRTYGRYCEVWTQFLNNHADLNLPSADDYLRVLLGCRGHVANTGLIATAVREAKKRATQAAGTKGGKKRWKSEAKSSHVKSARFVSLANG